MRFYSAVTKSPMRLNGVLTDGWHEFPAGTKLTATDAGSGKWHLNADRDGETYDGYADSAELEIGAVVATVNEPAADETPSRTSQYDYRAAELANVDATGEYPAKIKISSDDGDTKWLDITVTEFEQIRAVLLDYRNK